MHVCNLLSDIKEYTGMCNFFYINI